MLVHLATFKEIWKLAGIAFLIWVLVPITYFGLKFVASLWQMLIMGVAIGG